jgi:phytoene dehydrogenase-like protein
MTPAPKPSRSRYDALVIGAGHNGLVAATLLARAGKSVLVLEAAERLGGMAAVREFHPGFRAAIPHLIYQLHPAVSHALALDRHGFRLAAGDLPTVALGPDGTFLPLGDSARAAGEAARLPDFRRYLARLARALAPALIRTPPRLKLGELGSVAILGRLALGVRLLGRADMRELMRIIGMNVADLLEENFAADAIKGALALEAVLGNAMGPRSPNTVYTLLYRLAGEVSGRPGAFALPAGGMGALVEAMAGAARAAGAEVLSGAAVGRILVRQDSVAGVALATGDEIQSELVLSSADPRRSFLEILGPSALDTNFVRRARSWRDRGMSAKLHLALDRLPDGLAATPARFVVADSIDMLERGFDAAKYGELPERSPMEIVLPSAVDPGAAPAGKHLLSAIVHYVPYRLAAGDGAAARGSLADRLLDQLDARLPGLKSRLIAAELLAPADIERETGASGGHWHHGEIALDQVWMLRPQAGHARYRTPVAGLYLCGSGAHPGGGLTGLPGHNAARQALADARAKARSAA